jgi:hypothetical protein
MNCVTIKLRFGSGSVSVSQVGDEDKCLGQNCKAAALVDSPHSPCTHTVLTRIRQRGASKSGVRWVVKGELSAVVHFERYNDAANFKNSPVHAP